jgi:hypothetical protein
MRRLILSTAFLGFAAVASAQTASGPGWSAFSGCWTPVGADGSRNVAANTPRICVVQSGASADLVTIVNDSITDRVRVNADGQQHSVGKQGCSGWEKAEFSADGRRLFLRSEQTCAGGVKRLTSGIFAIASNGDMVNVVDVGSDSASSVRVTRYGPVMVFGIARPAIDNPSTAAEVRDALAARELSDRTARIAAQREVSIDAVIEASRFLSAPAEEAWLAELEQDFNLDDKTLVRLADEKVPPAVIDIMVAVSNPKTFSVSSTGSIEREEEGYPDRARTHAPCFAPVVDPWAWSAYDPCDPYLRYGMYRSRYYRGGYYGYYDSFYGGYGYGYPLYGNYGRPVIIVSTSDRPHGRMTKDGYKSSGSGSAAGGSSSSGSSAPRQATKSSGSSGSSGSSSSGTASSGSSSSGSSSSGTTSSGSGSSSSGRTATRKPPTI